jgi:hypothetical protein
MASRIVTIRQSEPDDENLRRLLGLGIFEFFSEIYHTNPHDAEGLLGAIVRFHSTAFDVPELNEIFAKIVES